MENNSFPETTIESVTKFLDEKNVKFESDQEKEDAVKQITEFLTTVQRLYLEEKIWVNGKPNEELSTLTLEMDELFDNIDPEGVLIDEFIKEFLNSIDFQKCRTESSESQEQTERQPGAYSEKFINDLYEETIKLEQEVEKYKTQIKENKDNNIPNPRQEAFKRLPQSGVALVTEEIIMMFGDSLIRYAELNNKRKELMEEAEKYGLSEKDAKEYVSESIKHYKSENKTRREIESAKNQTSGNKEKSISEGVAGILRKAGDISENSKTGQTLLDFASSVAILSVGASAALAYGAVRQGAKIISGFKKSESDVTYTRTEKNGFFKSIEEYKKQKEQEREAKQKRIQQQKDIIENYFAKGDKLKENDRIPKEQKFMENMIDVTRDISKMCIEINDEEKNNVDSKLGSFSDEQKSLLDQIKNGDHEKREEAKDGIKREKNVAIKEMRDLLRADRIKSTCIKLVYEYGITEEEAKEFLKTLKISKMTDKLKVDKNSPITLEQLEENEKLLDELKEFVLASDEIKLTKKEVIEKSEEYIKNEKSNSTTKTELIKRLDNYNNCETILQYAYSVDACEFATEICKQLNSISQEIRQLQSMDIRGKENRERRSELTRIAKTKMRELEEIIKKSGVSGVINDERNEEEKVINTGERILTRDIALELSQTMKRDSEEIERDAV